MRERGSKEKIIERVRDKHAERQRKMRNKQTETIVKEKGSI